MRKLTESTHFLAALTVSLLAVRGAAGHGGDDRPELFGDPLQNAAPSLAHHHHHDDDTRLVLGHPLVLDLIEEVDTAVGVNTKPTTQPTTKPAPISDVIAHFDRKALVHPITVIDGILSDGSHAPVYRIVVRSMPTTHDVGPWAPATIKDKGGYWEDTIEHKVYRVDGDYLKLLNSRGWDMFDADGTVHRTKTRAEFDKVARQEVGGWTFDQAKKDGVINSVIELKPSEQVVTIFIPKNPKPTTRPTALRQAPITPRSGIGVGIDGVRFFPPEPVNRITSFHNIAPLDPFGGHTGFGHEYHYHRAPAVMGDDKAGNVVGYALDGFPILGPTEPNGKSPQNLDQINGHDHDGLGYHYHAISKWPYFLNGFRGAIGMGELGELDKCDVPNQRRNGPGGGRDQNGGSRDGGPPGGGPPGGGPGGRRPPPPGGGPQTSLDELNFIGSAFFPVALQALLADQASTTQPAHPAAAHPNVLILLVDDLGWNGVGFHDKNAPTPNLNRLAKESLELQRFYTYPVCSPARAALLTGQQPRRFGIADVVGPRQAGLPLDTRTLPLIFKQAGYQTSLIGKWHVGSNGPMQLGFDHFYGFMSSEIDYNQHTNQRGVPDWQRDGQQITEAGYSTDLFATEAIRQLKSRDASKPCFIEVAFNAPHVPLSAPDELMKKYENNGGVYYAAIDAMDSAIGRILTALDDQKLRDNTLVLFYSDNGAGRRFSSNTPLNAGKDTVYEGGIRTPCLMRWPSQLNTGVLQQPVSAQDWLPTLAEAAHVPLDATLKIDGVSQWPALHDGKAIPRPAFLIASYDLALIDGDWKLIQFADGKYALYNLGRDISETKDEFANQPELAKQLIEKLNAQKAGLQDAGPRPQRPGPGGGAGGGGPGGRPNGGPPGPGRPRPN